MVKEAYLAVTEGLMINMAASYLISASFDKTNYLIVNICIGLWLYALSILTHLCLNTFQKTGRLLR